jgi:hypothetical protein
MSPNTMVVYDGRNPIGEIEDHGPRRVVAFELTPTGRAPIGTFPDRRTAMKAVSCRHSEASERSALGRNRCDAFGLERAHGSRADIGGRGG